MLRRSHPSYRALRAALVAARFRAGLTQRELAARLRVTPSTVARVELGERRLDVAELVAYARALGGVSAVGIVRAMERAAAAAGTRPAASAAKSERVKRPKLRR